MLVTENEVDLLYASYDEVDLLYASYDEVDLLYASYDEGTYCMLVMMRGPIVRQL